MTTYKGTSGNDDFKGTPDNDSFNVMQGGNDMVSGGGGNDTFRFGATFDTNDSIDGGPGQDRLSLNGDYSAGLFFNSAMMQNVERIDVAAGYSYSFVFFDSVIANGASLKVAATALGANDSLTVDGSYMSNASSGTQIEVYGGAGSLRFFSGPGVNILHGGSGQDLVYLGGDFDASDRLDGGAGNGDYLALNGDYSAGLTITATMMKNFESLYVTAGNSYRLTMSDGNVAAGQYLHVDADALAATESLNFNGAHETDGGYAITAGAGDDVLTGGAQQDFFYLQEGGTDRVRGGDGNDQFDLGGSLTKGDGIDGGDRIDGGDGYDLVELDGDYSHGLTFSATTMTNVEELVLFGQHSYALTLVDGNVVAGQDLRINASDLDVGDTLHFNGAHITNGHLTVDAGAGDDVIVGGQDGNYIFGGAGQDQITAGTGVDIFVYTAAGQSTGISRDILTGFDTLQDSFAVQNPVHAIDAAVTTGILGFGHFDANIAAAIGAAQLGAGDAVLFTPDAGNLAGHTFLVVDVNGIAGYQAGADLVIQLESATHLASLSTGDFGPV